MLVGENLIAHASFAGSGGAGAPTIGRQFRCVVTRSAAGDFLLTLDEDIAIADADIDLANSPVAAALGGNTVICNIARSAATLYHILTYLAAAAAPADPGAGTLVNCTLKRLDTV